MKGRSTGQYKRRPHVVAMVSTALCQSKLSGLSEMLRSVAEALNAFGCILWEVSPDSELDKRPPRGHLFVLAQWFRGGQNCALDNLPLDRSRTGEAILTQRPIKVDDIWRDERVFKNHPFLERAGVITLCSVPLAFLENTKGALNVYRTAPKPFNGREVAQIEQMASLVPLLYQAIRDKVSESVIRETNRILHEAELQWPRSSPRKDRTHEPIQTVCRVIADTFECMETSVFLEDLLEEAGRYELTGTTWPWPERFKKRSYKKGEEGLTGWVLASGNGVNILDLGHFKRDKESTQRRYPGLDWSDSLAITSAVREYLKLGPNEELPPISFMATPIVKGDRVLGVIRCSAPIKGPYYFSERELTLLQLIASQISHYWGNWVSRREMEQENRSWRAVVESVGRMNSFVLDELIHSAPEELPILAEALRSISSIIPSADMLDVRLLDEAKNELYFAQTHGPAWDQDSPEIIRMHRERRFPLDDQGPYSLGLHVFHTRKVDHISDMQGNPYYSETFPRVRRMIIAPISVADKVFGLLDIGTTAHINFPLQVEAIAGLLGQQLGLYHYLATAIRNLRRAEAELTKHVGYQARAFEDLGHQVRSPIIQAHARIRAALRADLPDDKLKLNLFAIRGLCGKAKRVALNTRVFAELAQEKLVSLSLSRLHYDYLVKMLIEAAMDNEIMINPERNLRFDVDKKGFEVLYSEEIHADFDLLEQAVTNLLDNAAKYSFPNTTVRIYGGLTGTGRFHLSVVNKGIPIQGAEIRLCIQRGWRSEDAKVTTGEGSGIGLWLVDNIMRTHGGELIVVPTLKGQTEAKLIFPAGKRT